MEVDCMLARSRFPHPWPGPARAIASLVVAVAAPVGLLLAGSAGADPGEGNGSGYGLSTIFSGAAHGISQPDDLTTMDGQLFVAFQNGVGPDGTPGPGGADSTVVEMSTTGVVEGTWALAGHCDGLRADPELGRVIATVNEDANSSLFLIDPSKPVPVQYTYSPSPLPHNGGTDAISIFKGQILVSASAPGTTGGAPPPATYPAVYAVSLDSTSHVASVTPVFSDSAQAVIANTGPGGGQTTTLALTDPDSNEVVPPQSPRFGGDFVLDSQGDQQQVYLQGSGGHQSLSVLNLSQSIDDSAWATESDGALYITDSKSNRVDVLLGHFDPGTTFVSVNQCDANNPPSPCANYLGTLDLTTGLVSAVDLGAQTVQPKGLLFASGSGEDDMGGNDNSQ
jgi:hypothetical protein